MLWFQLSACRLLSSTRSRTHTHWHRKRKPKWLLSDKLFSNFGWMLICVNGINLHKSINCLFALPLVCTPCPMRLRTHFSLILVLARPVHLGAPPLRENSQIGQKRKTSVGQIEITSPNSPTTFTYEEREEAAAALEKKWNDFFLLFVLPSLPLTVSLSFSCVSFHWGWPRELSLPPGG